MKSVAPRAHDLRRSRRARARSRSLTITAGPSSSSTAPLSISWTRRAISPRHTLSTSTGSSLRSRLSSSSRAASARSCAGSSSNASTSSARVGITSRGAQTPRASHRCGGRLRTRIATGASIVAMLGPGGPMGSLRLRMVLGAGFAAAVMLGGPEIARAQPDPGAPAQVDPQKKAAAKKLADDAQAQFDAQNYDKAIELYRKAFELIPHPQLMFNIAQAHRLAGRPDRAAPIYERYLQLDPDGPDAGAARAHLATIKAAAQPTTKTATQPTKPAERIQPGEPDKTGEAGPPAATKEDRPPPEGAQPVALRTREPDEPHRTDTASRPGGTLRTAGLVLGAAGLVSAA